jgi:hypothetical protein
MSGSFPTLEERPESEDWPVVRRIRPYVVTGDDFPPAVTVMPQLIPLRKKGHEHTDLFLKYEYLSEV